MILKRNKDGEVSRPDEETPAQLGVLKAKGAGRSLTVWFNGVLLLLLACYESAMLILPDVLAQLPQVMVELQDYLPDNIYKTMGLVVTVGNIMLRFRTSTALEDK